MLKKISIYLGVIALLVWSIPEGWAQPGPPEEVKVNWRADDFTEAINLAKKEKRPLFVYLYFTDKEDMPPNYDKKLQKYSEERAIFARVFVRTTTKGEISNNEISEFFKANKLPNKGIALVLDQYGNLAEKLPLPASADKIIGLIDKADKKIADIEVELDKRYNKAVELVEKNKYPEAIKELNKIIQTDYEGYLSIKKAQDKLDELNKLFTDKVTTIIEKYQTTPEDKRDDKNTIAELTNILKDCPSLSAESLIKNTITKIKKRGYPYKASVEKRVPTTIKELYELPEKDIDIAGAGLLIAQKVFPDMNIESYYENIKNIAETVKKRVGAEKNPQVIVEIINTYLFKEEKYQAVAGHPGGYDSFLKVVLDNKRGDPPGLALLYLSFAGRLNLPVYAVSTYGSVFVRYDDGQTRINIELGDEGRSASDEFYIKHDGLTARSVKDGLYLANLTKKQFISHLLVDAGYIFEARNEFNRAIEIMDWAIKFHPKNQRAYNDRGVMYGRNRDDLKAIEDFSKAVEIHPDYLMAYKNLAASYQGLNHFDKAVANLTEMIRIKPDADTYYWRGKLYVKELREWAKAVDDFAAIIKLDPNKASAYFLRGYGYEELGQKDKAEKDFLKAELLDPASFKSARENRQEILKRLP